MIVVKDLLRLKQNYW